MNPDAAAAVQRPLVRGLGPSLALAVLIGGVLTAIGWFGRDEGWRTAKHVPVFCGIVVLLLAAMWASRGLRLCALQLGAASAVVSAALIGQFVPLAVVAWMALSSFSLGRLVLRRHPTVGDFECTLVGMVGLGTVVGLLVGWPVNHQGVYALLLATPMWFARRELLGALRRWWSWGTAARQPGRAALVDELIAAAVAAIALVHFLVAAMPEFGHDALVFHLMMPLRIAWRGVWEFDVGSHVYAVLPALGNWLYTIACVLDGESAARFVNLGSVLLLGALVFSIARWVGAERRAALVAVLVFLTTPLTLTESSSLFIEGTWAVCVVGAASTTARLVSRTAAVAERRAGLLVAAVLAGGAMAAKAVTMVSMPLLVGLLAVRWRFWVSRENRPTLVAAVACFVGIGCQPYVRAWWITGNPVFPFFNGRFRSPFYPPENFAFPDIFGKGTTWDVLYRITFDSPRYLEALPGASGFQWLLLVVPAMVGFLVARQRRALLLAGFAAATFWLVFAQTAYLRYVFPTFAIATALAGASVGGALPKSWGRTALAAAALATVVLNLVCFSTGGYNHAFSMRVIGSAKAREAYVAERQPLRAAVRLLNELDGSDLPVAWFGPALFAGLHADVLVCEWYNPHFAAAVRAASSAEALGRLLAERRVRHLVLANTWWDEAVRQRVLDVSDEVCAIGNVSIRRLDERFRFQRELLLATRFEDPAAWSVHPDARVTPGQGARVTVAASAVQRIEVEPGREYRLRVVAQRVDPTTPTEARLQVIWLDGRGQHLADTIQVFACQAEASPASMDVVAPAGAAEAIVYATGHTQSPVLFRELSFRR